MDEEVLLIDDSAEGLNPVARTELYEEKAVELLGKAGEYLEKGA